MPEVAQAPFTLVELRLLLHLVNQIFVDKHDSKHHYIPPPHMARLIGKLESMIREQARA